MSQLDTPPTRQRSGPLVTLPHLGILPPLPPPTSRSCHLEVQQFALYSGLCDSYLLEVRSHGEPNRVYSSSSSDRPSNSLFRYLSSTLLFTDKTRLCLFHFLVMVERILTLVLLILLAILSTLSVHVFYVLPLDSRQPSAWMKALDLQFQCRQFTCLVHIRDGDRSAVPA